MKRFLVAVAVLSCLASVQAKPMGPVAAPLARMLTNLDTWLKNAPAEAQKIHYYRGRVHYFAFVQGVDMAYSHDQRQLQEPPGARTRIEKTSPRPYERVKPHAITEAERLGHLKAAIADLRVAQLEPGMAELCLACVLEDGAPFASKVGPIAGAPPSTKAAWLAEAERLYLSAYRKSARADAAATSSWGPESLVSFEASQSYERLVRARTRITPERVLLFAEMALHRQKLKNTPYMITPLIFSLTENQPLESLLAPKANVSFDLRGFGTPERGGWVQPETAFLVWDPEHTGKITSGRQLFGSATWWMLFNDAYEALAALDDNHDGWLTGKELSGLALWQDQNQNGVSDPGEVVPIEATPVVGIATHATGKTGLSPLNTQGLRLRDGRVLPTYDWTVRR